MAFSVTKDNKGRALMSCLQNKFFLFFLLASLQKTLPFEQEGEYLNQSLLYADKAQDWTLFTHGLIEEFDERSFLDSLLKNQESSLLQEEPEEDSFHESVDLQSPEHDSSTESPVTECSKKRDLNRERIASKKNRLSINLSKYLGEKSAFLQLLEQNKKLKSFLLETFAQVSADLTRTRRYSGIELGDLYKKAFKTLEKSQDQWLSADKASIDKDQLRGALEPLFARFVAAKRY